MPPLPLLLLPAVFQACVMLVDEGVFHRRRGLQRWERLGHPIDSLGIAACYAWLLLRSPSDSHALTIYIVLAAVSCLLVTKDEFVHARECEPLEHWLHAVLFILHPIVLAAFGILWWTGVGTNWITAHLVLTLAFALYQLVYWSVPWKAAR